MELVVPGEAHLPSYRDALVRGFSPSNLEAEAVRLNELEAIAADPAEFLASMTDEAGDGPPFRQPDGSEHPRLPGITRWMWDGDFCGSINLRWQPGASELPDYVPGHIGYVVAEWKRRRGYATSALGLLLEDARERGLEYVLLTAEEANVPSQRTIEANGGTMIGRFDAGDLHHSCEKAWLYRIDLT